MHCIYIVYAGFFVLAKANSLCMVQLDLEVENSQTNGGLILSPHSVSTPLFSELPLCHILLTLNSIN